MRRVIMHYKVILFSFYIYISLAISTAVEISSKLDFDETKNTKLLQTVDKYRPASYRFNKKENNQKDDFENIGVVSISTEKSNNSNANKSIDTIQTDVVVHVKTKVDLNDNNKKETADDNVDIPVIAGTRVKEQNNINTIRPVININDNLYTISSNLQSRTVHKPLVTSTNSGLIPASLKAQGRNFVNRNTPNAIEVQIPYLPSSYQGHYFGESQPQLVWYPKTNEYNVKATVRPAWTAATTQTYNLPSGVTCTCRNHAPASLQWYPSRRVYDSDSHVNINDKLASLD